MRVALSSHVVAGAGTIAQFVKYAARQGRSDMQVVPGGGISEQVCWKDPRTAFRHFELAETASIAHTQACSGTEQGGTCVESLALHLPCAWPEPIPSFVLSSSFWWPRSRLPQLIVQSLVPWHTTRKSQNTHRLGAGLWVESFKTSRRMLMAITIIVQ